MEHILSDIRQIIVQSRHKVARSINQELTIAYWRIGQRIVEEEQNGKHRANYGKEIVKALSKYLTAEYGEGFSSTNLWLMRQFFQTFPILHSLSGELTWTHYKSLIRIDNIEKREFFIAETIKNAWSVRQMERQIHSLLYERLLMSQDKDSVLAIAKGELQPFEPSQIIKDPTVLEFLGLKPQAAYYEIEIEEAIITHLHDFLLELGNGFSFVARQKRIVLDGDEFKLTWYSTIDYFNALCYSILK